jgi:hypothetical protein
MVKEAYGLNSRLQHFMIMRESKTGRAALNHPLAARKARTLNSLYSN